MVIVMDLYERVRIWREHMRHRVFYSRREWEYAYAVLHQLETRVSAAKELEWIG